MGRITNSKGDSMEGAIVIVSDSAELLLKYLRSAFSGTVSQPLFIPPQRLVRLPVIVVNNSG